MSDPLRIAVAGLGTVGAETLRLIRAQGPLIAARCGRAIEIAAVGNVPVTVEAMREWLRTRRELRTTESKQSTKLAKSLERNLSSDPAALEVVHAVYGRAIEAELHRAPTIRVAEAAKVIENTQRDVNIALINELAMIFNRMEIDTQEVLAAAGSKWNFLNFTPGLVGGHCIGVDPYYLTHKSQEIGYHPTMILAGRRINDNMGLYVASQVIRLMISKRIHLVGARILVMGLTFKENCPDVRNTKVVDIVTELTTYGAIVDIFDPWVSEDDAQKAYGLTLVKEPEKGAYDVVVIAVAHEQFKALGEKGIRAFGKPTSLVYDIKYVLPADASDDRL